MLGAIAKLSEPREAMHYGCAGCLLKQGHPPTQKLELQPKALGSRAPPVHGAAHGVTCRGLSMEAGAAVTVSAGPSV